MSDQPHKMTFSVQARRVDAHGSEATCKSAAISLDTDLAGRRDAFNPAELLLAALAACMFKGIERVTPILNFDFRGVEVRLHGVRQDVPPRMESIDYEILVDTDEGEQRLELLHENVKKFVTVFNTVAPGTELKGVIRPAEPMTPIRTCTPVDGSRVIGHGRPSHLFMKGFRSFRHWGAAPVSVCDDGHLSANAEVVLIAWAKIGHLRDHGSSRPSLDAYTSQIERPRWG